uniref:Uncharacterized protein n=1 Tax=Plectus sambesii TaxID=2011161 RepID=A0A914W4W2_9BILA
MCYLIIASAKKNWTQAKEHCNSMALNVHLASVSTAFESVELNALTLNTDKISSCDQVWIGAYDSLVNGTFVWSDGTPFEYSIWQTGEPNLRHQCVSSSWNTSRSWKTTDCNTENCFICKSDTGLMPTTSTPTTSSPVYTTTTTLPQTTTTKTTGGAVTTTTTVPGPTPSSFAMLNLDLVIAIDASATMPIASFNEIVVFLKAVLLVPYTIGQGDPGTRVAIIDVPGNNGPLFPSNNLQSITNRAALMQALDNVSDYYDGSAGQLFIALLQEITRPDFLSAGYRTGITNHLLLYITGTSTFTDGNSAAAFGLAQAIRNHKTYGIIIIAYKAATINANVLQGIAGGADCVLQAATVDQLNQQGIPLIQSKTLAGQYCGM